MKEDVLLKFKLESGPAPIIHAAGELNYTNCDRLKGIITNNVDGAVLELDLAGLEFVDSSGLRILLTGARDAMKQGATLRIVSMNRQFRHILDLSGLGHLFEIAPGACAPEAPLSVCRPVVSPYTFHVLCDGNACHDVRKVVREFAAGMGFDDVALDDISLAVGEAASNAVRHGNSHGATVEIDCRAEGCRLSLALRYPSDAFDPDSLPVPDMGAAPSGGMGVYFMRLVMDRVHYDFGDGCALLTLEKNMGLAELM
ncbi:MAG: anti-sigma factor antagonist [Armatimonadota bacterium]|nr:anti-sigma factor antagonist [Armatimonadota bacterium]